MPPTKISIAILAACVMASLTQTSTAQDTIQSNRFLDILQPGQHVRVKDLSDKIPEGIQLLLVPDKRWDEITSNAEASLEELRALERAYDDLEQHHEASSPVKNIDPNAILGMLRNNRNRGERLPQPPRELLEESVRMMAARREETRAYEAERDNLYEQMARIRENLPTSFGRIEAVGDDYFSVDTGDGIDIYPIRRLMKITRMPETAPVEPAPAELAPVDPTTLPPPPEESAPPATEPEELPDPELGVPSDTPPSLGE